MRWRKLGLVYAPGGERWWARSHAFIPTTHLRGDGGLRVYFTGLDEERYGRVGFVDLDPRDPSRVVYECQEPVLGVGPLGAFDDSGVNASCVVVVDEVPHLFYIGWQRAVRVPYMLFTGLARGDRAGESFERVQGVPVLDRTADEPFSRSAPCVVVSDGRWRAWYWSCRYWVDDPALGVRYDNVLRLAESMDGVRWTVHPEPLLEPEGDDYSLGRPWVIREGSRYRMWYSIRSRTRPYRIGYAESPDGVSWRRLDDRAGLEVSATGWDSEMVCFPCVVDAGGQRLMFYNGNRHGATGFGVAVLEQDD